VTDPSAPWKANADRPDYEDVRARIVDAAEVLIARDGVAALRLDSVAQAVGLHRSSLYRYFDTKEALISAVVVQVTLRVGEQVTADLDGADAATLLVEGIPRAMALLAAEPVHASLHAPSASEALGRISRNVLIDGIGPLLEPMFDAAAQQGVLRADVSSADAMRWLMLVASGLMRSPDLVTGEDDLRHLLRRMLVPALLETPAD
jgi:AcrR family transcriptional regulator